MRDDNEDYSLLVLVNFLGCLQKLDTAEQSSYNVEITKGLDTICSFLYAVANYCERFVVSSKTNDIHIYRAIISEYLTFTFPFLKLMCYKYFCSNAKKLNQVHK